MFCAGELPMLKKILNTGHIIRKWRTIHGYYDNSVQGYVVYVLDIIVSSNNRMHNSNCCWRLV